MMPALPPLNLSSSSSAKAGDIATPGNVYFGGFGSGSGGGGGGALDGVVSQYWPLAAVAAAVIIAMRRKQ